jgi:hypothetical protein
MLYSFIFFHTTIQVNDPEASLSNMSNTINKKPCKRTTQAGTNHKILLNSFFIYTKILIFITFFFTKNTFSLSFYFPTYTILKYDKNTRIRVLYNTRIFSNDPIWLPSFYSRMVVPYFVAFQRLNTLYSMWPKVLQQVNKSLYKL